MWKQLPKEEREFYKKEAEKEKHSKDNPGYKYRPKRRSNTLKVRPKKAKFNLYSHSQLQNAVNDNRAPQQQQPPLHHEQLPHQQIPFLTNPFYPMTYSTGSQPLQLQLQQPQQQTDFYTNPSYQATFQTQFSIFKLKHLFPQFTFKSVTFLMQHVKYFRFAKRFSGVEAPRKLFTKEGDPEKLESCDNENILSGLKSQCRERMVQLKRVRKTHLMMVAVIRNAKVLQTTFITPHWKSQPLPVDPLKMRVTVLLLASAFCVVLSVSGELEADKYFILRQNMFETSLF
ncbi:hypothetical protein HELRODRAFT_178672 [Helobdella robusta]|uniref:HMG box domain-containing protein n=1 Tax=Helobdella robusta TaxID=6412 RepID=T1FDJ7_HELRO|nr:hypothetical protein HELRODRAFT_178672 [Helobdella robusta]ESN96872.1 hypothetical protein HELRODRAFT_178672 [Helobdella robusta]